MSKNRMKCVIGAAVAALALAAACPSVARADYQWVTLDTPNTNSPGTDLYGITNSRIATGFDFTPAGPGSAGLIFNGTTATVVNAPGGSTQTELYQMNNAGQVAASYGDANSVLHAAVYDSIAKSWTTLPDSTDPANLPYNQATGINNHGLVAGTMYNLVTTTTGTPPQTQTVLVQGHSWTWNGTSYSPIAVPGADLSTGGTIAAGINDAATVVGLFTDSAGAFHGFIESGGSYTKLDYSILNLPASATEAIGINNSGVVVGDFSDGVNNHGFIYQNGSFSAPIDFPGAADTVVTAINDNGDLAGYYDDSTGADHGFEALVPEPASLSLLALGALMAFPRRRSRSV